MIQVNRRKSSSLIEIKDSRHTVSRNVPDLEAHLETKLFHRSTRALVPVDAERAYIASAKRILADIEVTEGAASGEYATPRGDLIISAPIALGRYYLQPVVTEFLAAFPSIPGLRTAAPEGASRRRCAGVANQRLRH